MRFIPALWTKLPVLVRAVLGGFLTQILAYLCLMICIPANMKHAPEVPWSLLPLGLALWGYWSYFGGKGRPEGMSLKRRRYRRSNPIPNHLRPAAALAGSLFSLTVVCVVVVQNSIHEMPVEALGLAASLADLPVWTSVPIALTAAFFVGVSEEMSFRGYMQVPIEDRHGPWLGLSVPALFFALAHGLDPAVLPVFFLVSIGWGILAWTTNSIRPGVIFHSLIDGCVFLWAIFRLQDLRAIMDYSLVDDGLTSGYRMLLIATGLLVLLTVAAFVMLIRSAGHGKSGVGPQAISGDDQVGTEG